MDKIVGALNLGIEAGRKLGCSEIPDSAAMIALSVLLVQHARATAHFGSVLYGAGTWRGWGVCAGAGAHEPHHLL